MKDNNSPLTARVTLTYWCFVSDNQLMREDEWAEVPGGEAPHSRNAGEPVAPESLKLGNTKDLDSWLHSSRCQGVPRELEESAALVKGGPVWFVLSIYINLNEQWNSL